LIFFYTRAETEFSQGREYFFLGREYFFSGQGIFFGGQEIKNNAFDYCDQEAKRCYLVTVTCIKFFQSFYLKRYNASVFDVSLQRRDY
jgi:hypothetical protein